jgi:hypothetical protein
LVPVDGGLNAVCNVGSTLRARRFFNEGGGNVVMSGAVRTSVIREGGWQTGNSDAHGAQEVETNDDGIFLRQINDLKGCRD